MKQTIETMNPQWTAPMLEALALASQVHEGHFHKGSSIPYLSHLLGVASLVMEFEGAPTEMVASLLHDTLERTIKLKQPVEPFMADLTQRFGPEVAAVVQGCSDCQNWPRPKWRERKEGFLASLDVASPSVLLVSLCDKLHNAQTTWWDFKKYGDEVWENLKGKKDGTLWYYDALIVAYRKRFEREAVALEHGRANASFQQIHMLFRLLAIFEAHVRLLHTQT